MVDRLEPFSWKVDGCRVHRCFPSDDGRYVSYSDYAALQAENERLKVERVDLEQFRGSVLRDYSSVCEREDMPKVLECERLLALIDAHKGE